MTLQLFQQQKVAPLIYSACLAVNATKGLTPLALKVLFNNNFFQKQIIFMHQSIVFESTDHDVAKTELVDTEQSMKKFGSQVLSIHYFLVCES